MLYSLVLVFFMSNGIEHRIPLMDNIGDYKCIDIRDDVRGSVNYLNELPEMVSYDGSLIEFVDAECVAQPNVF